MRRRGLAVKTVTLGATRLEVTPVAYGTWPFGGDRGPVGEQAVVEAIGQARSLGVNFFDTAHAYGFGRCERVLGRTLADDPRSARDMAWLLAHPAVQVAIAGSRTAARLRDSAAAVDLVLCQADLTESTPSWPPRCPSAALLRRARHDNERNPRNATAIPGPAVHALAPVPWRPSA
jgi:aryl-alcohol dehydrogenase-like predicted oxidoreductase